MYNLIAKIIKKKRGSTKCKEVKKTLSIYVVYIDIFHIIAEGKTMRVKSIDIHI